MNFLPPLRLVNTPVRVSTVAAPLSSPSVPWMVRESKNNLLPLHQTMDNARQAIQQQERQVHCLHPPVTGSALILLGYACMSP